MKLTYSNWHKELVHDDSIQSELLSAITQGELEFNNRPFVKHRVEDTRDDYGKRSGNNFRKNFLVAAATRAAEETPRWRWWKR